MPPVDTIITAVTVYTDRAAVTRAGSVSLPAAGPAILTVERLPVSLLTDSTRARGAGSARVRINAIEARRVYHEKAQREDIGQLRDSVEQLKDQVGTLDEQIKEHEQGQTFLRALGEHGSAQFARGLAFGRMETADVAAYLRFTREQTRDQAAGRAALQQQRRELERKLKQAEQSLRQWDHAPRDSSISLDVSVDVLAPGEFNLEVTYVVTGARWAPLYDIRLQQAPAMPDTAPPSPAQVPYGAPTMPPPAAPRGTVSLTLLGQITQTTSENWRDCALTLSTARPSMGALPPKLPPWFVDVYRPAPPVMRPMAARMPMGAAAPPPLGAPPTMEAFAMPVMQEAEVSMAEVESSGASVTYRLSGGIDVPSDGSPHTTTIGRQDFSASLEYLTMPLLVAQAYLRATVKNAGDFTLLPGKANLFHGDEFVGSTDLELVAPGQEFSLDLGPDATVQVKRELSGYAVDKTVLRDLRRTTYGYRITVENLRDAPIPVTIRDRVPVSRAEEVKIRFTRSDPAPSDQDRLGIITWQALIPPASKRIVNFEFLVEYPRSVTVTGLGLPEG